MFGKMVEDSGRLAFVDDCVNYASATYGSWRLDASSIRLIGEFTNQSGPYMDDYFFVFFRHGGDGWYDASYYCDGRDEVWKALTARFPGLTECGLGNSADFKSRVLWPAEHAGKPLFDFRPMKRGDRWHDRLLDRLLPPFVVESVLRPEFQEERSQQSPAPHDHP
jgi:hypothetical protein